MLINSALSVKIDDFWNKFSKVVHELTPINKKLIQKRENIQKKIDDWHKSRKEKDFDKAAEDLRLATRHLGMLVGKVDVEEILGSIFKANL